MSGGERTAAVTFRRLGDVPPPERELLAVAADGTAWGWRSNGTAIGRFSGGLGAAAAVLAAAAAASAADDEPLRTVAVPAGASVETIEADGRTATVEARHPVDGAWGPLADACRIALDALVEVPLAAIAATVGDDGALVLEHQGADVLPVELMGLAATWVRWHDGSQAARGRVAVPDLDRVEAGPGWRLVLPLPPEATAGPGSLVVTAMFIADDDGIYVPVQLTARRAADA